VNHDIDLDDYACDRCDSTQTPTPDPIHVDIMWIKVCHTAGCPFLARVRAAGSN
jgi:hypothetical protein